MPVERAPTGTYLCLGCIARGEGRGLERERKEGCGEMIFPLLLPHFAALLFFDPNPKYPSNFQHQSYLSPFQLRFLVQVVKLWVMHALCPFFGVVFPISYLSLFSSQISPVSRFCVLLYLPFL
jgi:hypothetical protein